MSRQKRKECGHRRKTCKNKGLKHPSLGKFENFFKRRTLLQEFLCRSQNMDRIVNTNAKNNGRHKNRKRVHLTVEQSGKCKRRNASIKHRCRHKDRAFHAPEEEHCQKHNQDKAYAERENGIISHFIDFFKPLISSFYRESRRNRISFAAEESKQGISAFKNMRYKLIIRRWPDELCIDNTIEQDFPCTVRTGATNKTRLQIFGNRLFAIPFRLVRRCNLLLSFFFILLKERIKSTSSFIREAQLLR